MDELHYLVVRPISERACDAESVAGALAPVIGIDKPSLVGKLTGPALQVLKNGKDKNSLDDIACELKREKVSAAVVSQGDMRPGTRAARSASVEVSAGKISFLSIDGGAVMTIDEAKSALMVLGSLDPEKIVSKRLVRSAMGNAATLRPEELIDLICMNDPVLDVYSSGSPKPARIDGSRFNYSSLGEKNRGSAVMNLKVIIACIQKSAKTSLIDTGFGQSPLPFVTIERETGREARISEFDAYSRFISLSAAAGIFKPPDGVNASRVSVPIFSEPGGLLWGGPLLISADAHMEEKMEDDVVKKPALPSPPTDAFARKSGLRFRSSILGVDNLRSLGPRAIVAPLVAIIMAAAASASYLERMEPVPIGVLAFGLLLFTHSFVLLKRKRALENCPTAKIGTMPMGEVEVYGRARSKFALRAPYSLTDCVYYSYKVYEALDTADGPRRNLKEWGSSEHVPFYIEDDTGAVTVTPSGAIVHAGRTDTLSGDVIGGLIGNLRASGEIGGKIIVETVIPTGSLLFVTGFADRTRGSAHERKKRLIDRLRHLKTDPAHIGRYDADRDGKLSADEWESAKRDAEEALLLESPQAESEADRVAIGEHPTGGLFYISDKKEEHIIRSIAWRIPLALGLGVAVTTIGAVMVLQLLRGKGILGNILRLL
jgi:hypothetical protein